jgi:hypothetical protein
LFFFVLWTNNSDWIEVIDFRIETKHDLPKQGMFSSVSHLSSWSFFVLWKMIPRELERFISVSGRHTDCEIEDEICWLPTKGTFSSVPPLRVSAMTLNLLYRDKFYSKHCQPSCKNCGTASRLATRLPLISHRLLKDALDLPRESCILEFLL